MKPQTNEEIYKRYTTDDNTWFTYKIMMQEARASAVEETIDRCKSIVNAYLKPFNSEDITCACGNCENEKRNIAEVEKVLFFMEKLKELRRNVE